MSTFDIYDVAGVGWNMPSTTAGGFVLATSDVTVTGVVFDTGSVVLLNMSGSSVFDQIGFTYTIIGDFFEIFDVGYYRGGTLVADIIGLNVVGSVSVLQSGGYVGMEVNTLDDTINGNNFSDLIHGGPGEDLILGYGGSDILNGDDGNDLLVGGLGKDFLNGGAGFDSFYFSSKAETRTGPARDVILDFDRVFDLIDLSAMDARKGPGNQAFKFIGAQAFHSVPGELHLVKHGGRYVTLEGDIDGNGRADFQIDVHSLTNNLNNLGRADIIF